MAIGTTVNTLKQAGFIESSIHSKSILKSNRVRPRIKSKSKKEFTCGRFLADLKQLNVNSVEVVVNESV